ncbi:hypothetical protein ADILRU_2447 [Leifsonia rubra CMS 76R]|nr:hypothetical protein ADILRU_2447 [Leifsonia rubra CMS 76R]
MRRTLLITTALAVSAFTLSGCSAASSDLAPAESQEHLVQESAARDSGLAEPLAEGGIAVNDALADTAREVITTGYMSVTVTSPDEASSDAIRITESVGGRVDGRSEYAPNGGDRGSATLTLRIPSSELTATLDKFKELGTLQEVSINSVDVTMESRDLEARVTALDASVERLLALLSTAEDTDTLIKLETAISDRQGELESLKSQKRYFDDQVAMSTLTLSLVSVADAPTVEPDNFFAGLIAGWNSFIAFFAGLLITLGVLVPWLIFAAIIAGIVVLIVRSKRRARRIAAATPLTPAEIPEPSQAQATD